MSESKKRGVSSHLADAFFQIEELKKGHFEGQDLILVELEKSIDAIAREVYTLKKELLTVKRGIDTSGT